MDPQSLLDPEIAAVLGALPSPLTDLTLEQIPGLRAARKQQFAAQLAAVPPSPHVTREDRVVPGPPGAPDVTVGIYRPRGVSGPVPSLYWMHGGGYIFGAYDAEYTRLDPYVETFGCTLVSVEYRLAPETPYPGPLEDAYAALKWVHDAADEIGVDPGRLGIGGGSAGGGLAAALALLARDRGEVPLAFQLLVYPMIDDRQTTPSSGWDVPVWNPKANELGWRSYLGPLYGTDSIPYWAAPSRAHDLAGLPPALVAVGTLDGFVDEDIDYASRLNRAGVPVELHVYPGSPHGFYQMAPDAAISRRFRRHAFEWLEPFLGAGGS